jgi:hypothetical protein
MSGFDAGSFGAAFDLSSLALLVANGGQKTAVSVIAPDPMTTPLPLVWSTLQQQLNDNVQWYPQSAALMAAAVGYGTWSAGWLCNEASGGLAAAFGSPALVVATGTAVYDVPGPRAGIDKAIAFDTTTDRFIGGNVFNVDGSTDLVIGAVVRLDSDLNGDILGKGWAGGVGYILAQETGGISIYVDDGPNQNRVFVGAGLGVWYALLVVVDRGGAKVKIAYAPLTGGATQSNQATLTAGSLSNALDFQFGSAGAYGATLGAKIAALYIGTGSGIGASLSTNIATATQNFAAAINAAWSIPFDASTGLVSIGLSPSPPAGIPSFSIDWLDAAQRSLMGFTRDIDYPKTAAEIAADVGYGTWSAGWLCNEESGNLAAVFGSPALTAAGTPLYGIAGPRGGADKAVGVDGAADQWTGGDTFDVSGTDDLCLAWVGRFSASPPTTEFMFTKGDAGAPSSWSVRQAGDGLIHFLMVTSSGSKESTISTASIIGQWYVGIAVIDRGSGNLRVGLRTLSGTEVLGTATALFAGEAVANANNFTFSNRGAALPCVSQQFAAFYIGLGTSVAAGLSTNLSTALANVAATFGARYGTMPIVAVSNRYQRMMSALLPPGRVWR